MHHRIFICDPSKSANVATNGQVVVMNIVPGSEKADATAMRPTNVIAQADIIAVLQKSKASLGDVVGTKIEDLHMFMVRSSAGISCAGNRGNLYCQRCEIINRLAQHYITTCAACGLPGLELVPCSQHQVAGSTSSSLLYSHGIAQSAVRLAQEELASPGHTLY